MNIRRSAALVAATVVIGGATAPAALADGASPSASPKVTVPSGLYGSGDPTYDGVWRQSLAFVAQRTEGVQPAAKAVDWLAGQQCEDGGFAAFRAEPGKACDAKTAVDSNSTAAAVQALAAVGGHKGEVAKGVAWLKKNQNADGGWGYNPGGASDGNSTAVVLGALSTSGDEPAEVRSGTGKSGFDALGTLALPCSEGKNGGALAYQPDKKGELVANADATAAGVLGALGSGFAAEKGEAPDAYTCESGDAAKTSDGIAHNGAVYLQNQLSTHLYLKSQLAGATDQPDYGNTADAVTAVAAAEGIKYTKDPYAWLEKNAQDWAKGAGPAAYAQLIFAAHATGNDPRDFGGTDLVSALNRTGPDPASAKSAADSSDEKKDDGGSGVSWWIVGVMFIAAVGAGILISGRKKQQK